MVISLKQIYKLRHYVVSKNEKNLKKISISVSPHR